MRRSISFKILWHRFPTGANRHGLRHWSALGIAGLAVFLHCGLAHGQTINTTAGTGTEGYSGDGAAAVSAKLNKPYGVAVSENGDVYFADKDNEVVRKVDVATGVITTIAGGGSIGDGGAAGNSILSKPNAVFVDSSGNVFIADTDHHRIRRIDGSTGIITTIAGTGDKEYSGDGGAAIAAELNKPSGVVVDSAGNVIFADTDNHRIRRITPGGIISTIGGTGSKGYSGDGGAATSAQINKPRGIAIDGSDNLFFADADNHRIRKIAAGSGTITTVAGTGSAGYGGDGGAATSAKINKPYDVWVDGSGNIYIADKDNHRARKIKAANGKISTIAGTGSKGFSGDGGAATSAKMDHLEGIAVDAAGNVFIADSHNNRIRKINAGDGKISTFAGTGAEGYTGDGGAATLAKINKPSGVFVDASGNVYFSDKDNNTVRRVDASTGIITTATIAGEGNGLSALAVDLGKVEDVTMGPSGNLFIACEQYDRVERVDLATGLLYHVMGYGAAVEPVNPGDDILLDKPAGVAVDDAGNVYVAEKGKNSNRIRKLTVSTGIYSTIAGTGSAGYSGDGGPATAALLNKPSGVAVDKDGNVYIADKDNHRVRKIDAATGIITTVAGIGSDGADGDDGLATSAKVGKPSQVQVDRQGNLYIAQKDLHLIRKVAASNGVITTIAGTGSIGNSGDGGDPTLAMLNKPVSIGFKRITCSVLYIGDSDNHKVRGINMCINRIKVLRWREVPNSP